MKIDMKKRSRSWAIVINEKTMEDYPQLSYDKLGEYIKKTFDPAYFCFCEENGKIGDEDGQEQIHIHLYMELNDAMSGTSVKKKLGTAHLEHRMGNPSECRDYVFKTGTHADKSVTNTRPAVEYGDWDRFKNVKARGLKPKGERKLSPSEKLAAYVEQYDSLKEVREADLYFAKMYRDELEEAFESKAKEAFFTAYGKREESPSGEEIAYVDRSVYYLYGPSRCGKNFGLALKYGTKNIYYASSSDSHLFDDYDRQPVLAIDEFRSNLTLTAMLRLTDIYDVTLPCRYRNKKLLAHTIVVMSNWTLEEQYKNVQTESGEDYRAFCNRFVRGVWRMEYDQRSNRRFICCTSTKEDFSPGVWDKLNFDEPPVFCDGKKTVHVSFEDFAAIKWLIDSGKDVTEESIQAVRDNELFWVIERLVSEHGDLSPSSIQEAKKKWEPPF